jgi:hypothetical protein
VSAAVSSRLFDWQQRGEGVAVDAVLGADGLLVTVESDGLSLEVLLPPGEVRALLLALHGTVDLDEHPEACPAHDRAETLEVTVEALEGNAERVERELVACRTRRERLEQVLEGARVTAGQMVDVLARGAS